MTRLVEHDGTQGTSIFHSQLQGGIGLLFASVVANDTAVKGGALIWIQLVTSEFAMRHPTDGMDEVTMVQIFKPILIWAMSVGATVEVQSRRVFHPILVTSILGGRSEHVEG